MGRLRRREPYAPLTSQLLGIQFDSASNSGYQAASSSYSWSHTCSGSNRFLSVDIAVLSVLGTTVTGITYNSIALSFLGSKTSGTGSDRIETWGLIAPATGSNTIAVTLSASVASSGVAVSYTGVHQTSPTEGFNSNEGTNGGSPADATVDITSVANNCWIHAAVATNDTTITANQTTRNNVSGALGSGADEDFGPQTPAGTKTMSYTNVGALAPWAIAGYALRPTAASSLAVAYIPYDIPHSPAFQSVIAM